MRACWLFALKGLPNWKNNIKADEIVSTHNILRYVQVSMNKWSRKKWFSCGWIQANYIQFVIKNMCCFFWQINWWSLPELAVLIHNLYSIKDGTEYKIPVQYDLCCTYFLFMFCRQFCMELNGLCVKLQVSMSFFVYHIFIH